MEHRQIEQLNFLDLLKTLETYKRVLDSKPTHTPRPGLYYQFEFWNDAGTMKLCFFAEGDWYEISATKII